MSLYNIYAFCLLVAFFLGSLWSYLDRDKPPRLWEFIAKLIARSLTIFVLLVVIVGFFALLSAGLSNLQAPPQ